MSRLHNKKVKKKHQKVKIDCAGKQSFPDELQKKLIKYRPTKTSSNKGDENN